jgi:hypothetical protein
VGGEPTSVPLTICGCGIGNALDDTDDIVPPVAGDDDNKVDDEPEELSALAGNSNVDDEPVDNVRPDDGALLLVGVQ